MSGETAVAFVLWLTDRASTALSYPALDLYNTNALMNSSDND
jgi:hypothetical protein